MTDKRERLLLVEDDQSLGFLIKDILVEQDYLVSLCETGEAALEEIHKYQIDLCILDVMLPTMDGFELASKIRSYLNNMPFLFLTARSLKEDKLKGYAIGAEDYVTKPFDPEILLCKIKAILQRVRKNGKIEAQEDRIFQIGKFTFNYHAHSLSDGETHLRLTEKENEVLYLLCINLNRVVRRDDAVERIYGKRDYFLGRSFDVFISKIRKYLSSDPRLQIENVYRVGFILTDGSKTEVSLTETIS